MPPQPDEQNTLRILRQVAESTARAVLPIVDIDGNRRTMHTASAFVLDCDGELLVVTAAHALEGENAKGISGPTNVLVLSRPAKRIRSAERPGPDFDLAYYPITRAEFEGMGCTYALPFGSAAQVPPVAEGDLFVAMGHPVSRSKVRSSLTLTTDLAVITMNAVSPTRLPDQPRLDEDFHVALQYIRRQSRTVDDRNMTGVFPRGMSGGPLLRPRWDDMSQGRMALDVVGVIIEYHERNKHLLVVSRIEPIVIATEATYPRFRGKLPRISVSPARFHFTAPDV